MRGARSTCRQKGWFQRRTVRERHGRPARPYPSMASACAVIRRNRCEADSSDGEVGLHRLDLSLNLDRDSIVYGYDAGRRPRRSLCLFSLRPGAHPTLQDRFVALHLDGDLVGVNLCISY